MAAPVLNRIPFSRFGGLDLLHSKVVDLAPPYSQRHGHTLQYMNMFNYPLTGTVPVSVFQ